MTLIEKISNRTQMRIHLKIKAQSKVIPFAHQHFLTGTIHKWLGGKNQEHGEVSLYSFSQLMGGKASKAGLTFDRESSFFFSAHNPELIKRLIDGIQLDPNMFQGLTVCEIILQQEVPDFTEREIFYSASPIFIKRKNENGIEHIIYTDERANACLKETLQTKMEIAAIEDDSLEIYFDKDHSRASTKLIKYNGVENRSSWCNVIIKGKPETKLFAWNVGLGNSTGIGFGAIK